MKNDRRIFDRSDPWICRGNICLLLFFKEIQGAESVKKKAERYITVRSPPGYKIIKQEYIADFAGGCVKKIRVFFEMIK